MGISAPSRTDDDGTGTFGDIINVTSRQQDLDAINAMSLDQLFATAATPTIFGASQNNYALPTIGFILNISASLAVNLTGMVANRANQIVTLVNVGSFTITIKHENASSSAANRFFMTGAADISLPSNAVRTFVYTAATSRWRPVIDG